MREQERNGRSNDWNKDSEPIIELKTTYSCDIVLVVTFDAIYITIIQGGWYARWLKANDYYKYWLRNANGGPQSNMGLVSLIFGLPFEIARGYIFKPALDRTYSRYEDYKTRTKEGVSSAREVAFKLAIVALAAAVIIWLAIFMYIAFYYTYMPAIAHIRPVHMQFKWVNESDFIISHKRHTNFVIDSVSEPAAICKVHAHSRKRMSCSQRSNNCWWSASHIVSSLILTCPSRSRTSIWACLWFVPKCGINQPSCEAIRVVRRWCIIDHIWHAPFPRWSWARWLCLASKRRPSTFQWNYFPATRTIRRIRWRMSSLKSNPNKFNSIPLRYILPLTSPVFAISCFIGQLCLLA